MQSYCYKEISNADILISIIGSRFGNDSEGDKEYSISNMELKTAIENNKHAYIFVEKNILTEYETYLLNKGNKEITYKYVDSIRIYKFLEEIKALHNNNNIKDFETADDITVYLREQFAGLMKNFFDNEERYKETSLIKDINTTSKTLKNLIDYIQSTNTESKDKIKEIISTTHPIINDLKKKISYIKFKYYFDKKDDIISLFRAYGFHIQNTKTEDLTLIRDSENDTQTLSFNHVIFDEDDNLKYFKPDDWSDKYITYSKVNKKIENDDLPF